MTWNKVLHWKGQKVSFFNKCAFLYHFDERTIVSGHKNFIISTMEQRFTQALSGSVEGVFLPNLYQRNQGRSQPIDLMAWAYKCLVWSLLGWVKKLKSSKCWWSQCVLVMRAIFRICGNESQPGLQLVEKLATPLVIKFLLISLKTN